MDKSLTDEFPLLNVEQQPVRKSSGMLVHMLVPLVIFTMMSVALVYYKGAQPSHVKLGGFFILGLAFLLATKKRIALDKGFLPTIVSAILVQIAAAVFSLAIGRFELFSHVAFFAAFLLPLIVFRGWLAFLHIPTELPQALVYHPSPVEKSPVMYLENRKVKVQVIVPGQRTETITTTLPVQQPLGTSFDHLLLERENNKGAGNLMSENGKPYGWIFYTRAFGWRKNYLDPGLNLYENNVPLKATIIAERIVSSF